ncbi:hypothetical protein GWD52_20980 [Enterobacteriaceae bacterium 4M9]|nr:hypothetical protein [Enterobacteriaceae bacterium 4M9]
MCDCPSRAQAEYALAQISRVVKALAAENAGLKHVAEQCREFFTAHVSGRLAPYNPAYLNGGLIIELSDIKATDAAIADMRNKARIEGINYAASRLAAAFEHGFVDKPISEVGDIVRMILTAAEEVVNHPAEDGLSGEYARDALKMWEKLIMEARSNGE